MPEAAGERSPLLQDQENDHEGDRNRLELTTEDDAHPRSWPKWRKLANIAIIASMAILSPLASSMFAPGIQQIAESLDTTENGVILCQTGFVIMLGIGPLVLAPLSETFGRKNLYLICFGVFTFLQIPTALAKSLPVLVFMRTIAGFFGSISIANGGGTISDMFEPRERAGIFGWYLLGPLFGPSVGPLLGGVILHNLEWPWLFWILFIVGCVVMTGAFFFLKETYVPVLLAQRKEELEKAEGRNFYFEGEDSRPLKTKLLFSIIRPLKILFTQPIVLTMASYQALIFATTYSLYTQFEKIYKEKPYNFSTIQVGFVYLGPGLGFISAVCFLVPQIDKVYNRLSVKHDGEKPEYRLPIANVGSALIPISLFAFAWLVEYRVHWFATIVPTFFYGIGQVAVFNSVQNYYIDSFEKYAASAIAAGAFFRSLIGGLVPLMTGSLLDAVGVGWGMSVFAFISVALAPSPLLFYRYGDYLRKRFAIDL